ncbi:MAG: hypothetical protein ACK5LJ_13305 [Paracoccus sp. (in: a-proteobacteria)]
MTQISAPEFVTLENGDFSNLTALAAAGLSDSFFNPGQLETIIGNAVGFEGDENPDAVVMHYPSEEGGLALLATTGDGEFALMNAWPFLPEVLSTAITPLRVGVSEDGLQAIVTARIGDAVLSFFDDAYIVSAPSYRGGLIRFGQFYAICSQGRPADLSELEVDPEDPDYKDYLAAGFKPDGRGVITLPLEGTSMILPRADIAPNAFEFRGPVISVEPQEDWLAPDAAILRVSVMRPFEDEDGDQLDEGFDLPILLRRDLIEGGTFPEPGDDFQGLIFLYGTGFEEDGEPVLN